MKRVQVCEENTGDSQNSIALQDHVPIVFRGEDPQDYEYPEEWQMRNFPLHESSELLFSQGPSDNDKSLAHLPIFGHEDSENSEVEERGQMVELDYFGIEVQDEDWFFRELMRIHENPPQKEEASQPIQEEALDEEEEISAEPVVQEEIDVTRSSENIRQEAKVVNESRSPGLSEKWRRILRIFQDLYHKFKKNVNFPKAIGRYFMQHYPTFEKALFANDPSHFAELSERLQSLKEWVKESKKNSFKLQHLEEFFGDKVRTRRESQLNRLMMRKILQRQLREEIIPNNQVKDKLEYLVATKVYGLRCGSAVLAKRMQMR